MGTHALRPGEVRINLMQRTDKTLYYEVKVRSEIKPMVSKVGITEHSVGVRGNARRVVLLAAAMAEQLCEEYGDTLDPADVAREAAELMHQYSVENPHIFFGDEAPRAADKAIAARVLRR